MGGDIGVTARSTSLTSSPSLPLSPNATAVERFSAGRGGTGVCVLAYGGGEGTACFVVVERPSEGATSAFAVHVRIKSGGEGDDCCERTLVALVGGSISFGGEDG